MSVERPEYLLETTTATLGIDEEGLVVLRLFGGLEMEMDVRATGLVRAGQPRSALNFIEALLNRVMTDNLLLANLYPRRRPTPAEKAAIKAAKVGGKD